MAVNAFSSQVDDVHGQKKPARLTNDIGEDCRLSRIRSPVWRRMGRCIRCGVCKVEVGGLSRVLCWSRWLLEKVSPEVELPRSTSK